MPYWCAWSSPTPGEILEPSDSVTEPERSCLPYVMIERGRLSIGRPVCRICTGTGWVANPGTRSGKYVDIERDSFGLETSVLCRFSTGCVSRSSSPCVSVLISLLFLVLVVFRTNDMSVDLSPLLDRMGSLLCSSPLAEVPRTGRLYALCETEIAIGGRFIGRRPFEMRVVLGARNALRFCSSNWASSSALATDGFMIPLGIEACLLITLSCSTDKGTIDPSWLLSRAGDRIVTRRFSSGDKFSASPSLSSD